MNWNQPDITWAPLVPILVVLLAAAAGILVEAFVRTPATRRIVQLSLSLGALVVALGAAIVLWATMEGAGTLVLRTMLVVDRQSLAWQVMLTVFGILGVLLFAAKTRAGEEAFTPLGSTPPGSLDETRALRAGMQVTEVFPLALFAAGGMMLFTAVTDFVFLFVVLELFSLALYVLVALARRRRALSHEAALKYFLLGAFSSAIYIFGAALIYGVPHFVYHATHLDPYDTDDQVALIVSLSIAVLAAILAVAAPTQDDPATARPDPVSP